MFRIYRRQVAGAAKLGLLIWLSWLVAGVAILSGLVVEVVYLFS
jgi:hypothetical protein